MQCWQTVVLLKYLLTSLCFKCERMINFFLVVFSSDCISKSKQTDSLVAFNFTRASCQFLVTQLTKSQAEENDKWPSLAPFLAVNVAQTTSKPTTIISLDAADDGDRITHCCGCCPCSQRMCSSIPGLWCRERHPRSDKLKWLQLCQTVPWETKSPQLRASDLV